MAYYNRYRYVTEIMLTRKLGIKKKELRNGSGLKERYEREKKHKIMMNCRDLFSFLLLLPSSSSSSNCQSVYKIYLSVCVLSFIIAVAPIVSLQPPPPPPHIFHQSTHNFK